MTTHKKKKVKKYRGSKTHGCGSMKKRRGAGNRGGRGRAGSGKRADTKKPSYQTSKGYQGKHGFTSVKLVKQKKVKGINIGLFEEKLSKLVKQGLVEEKSGTYVIDLNKIGYDKLLASGNTNKKLMITADSASESAVEKVKKAGGDVLLPEKKEKKKDKTASKDKKKEKEPEED